MRLMGHPPAVARARGSSRLFPILLFLLDYSWLLAQVATPSQLVPSVTGLGQTKEKSMQVAGGTKCELENDLTVRVYPELSK